MTTREESTGYSTAMAREMRVTLRTDAWANVVWILLFSGVQSFALVLAWRMGAGTLLISAGAALLYIPGAFTWIVPLLCRRFPLGGVMLGLRALAGAGTLACLCFPSLWGLALGFGILTIAGGWVEAVYPAFLHAVYPPNQQNRVMGLIFTARALASFGWLLLLGGVLNAVSPRNGIRVLGLMGVLGFITAAICWRFRTVQEKPATTSPEAADGLPPHANGEFIRYLISLTIYGVGIMFSLFITPILQVDIFRLTNGQVGALAAVTMITQMFSYLFFSRYGVVHPSNRLLGFPYMMLAAPITLSAVLMLLHLYPPYHAVPFPALLAAACVGGVGTGIQGMYFYLVVNALAGSASALRYQSFQQAVVGIRGVVTPFIAGLVFAHYHALPCVLVSSLTMLGGGVAAFFLSGPRCRHARRRWRWRGQKSPSCFCSYSYSSTRIAGTNYIRE